MEDKFDKFYAEWKSRCSSNDRLTRRILIFYACSTV